MGNTYKYSGHKVPVATGSGTIANNALVVQEGIFGIAQNAIASGAAGIIAISGVHHIAVPSGTVKGDVLYAAGHPATESAAVTLTKTSTNNTPVGRALADRGTDNKADVLLFDNVGNVGVVLA